MKKLRFFIYGLSLFCVFDEKIFADENKSNVENEIEKSIEKKDNQVSQKNISSQKNEDTNNDDDEDEKIENEKTESDIFSAIKWDNNASDFLKENLKFINSSEFNFVKNKLEKLSRKLSKKKIKSEDADEVNAIIKKSILCFNDLLRSRSKLYQKLSIEHDDSNEIFEDDIEIDEIIKKLSYINLAKCEEIIKRCEENHVEYHIIGYLENFVRRVKESKEILQKMKDEFSPIILAQIEGAPAFTNLAKTNTEENQNSTKPELQKDEAKDEVKNDSEKDESKDEVKNDSEKDESKDEVKNASKKDGSKDEVKNDSEKDESKDEVKNASEKDESKDEVKNASEEDEAKDEVKNDSEKDESKDEAKNDSEKDEAKDKVKNDSEKDESKDEVKNASEEDESKDEVKNASKKEKKEVENSQRESKKKNIENKSELFDFIRNNIKNMKTSSDAQKKRLEELNVELEKTEDKNQDVADQIDSITRISKMYNRLVSSGVKNSENKRLPAVSNKQIQEIKKKSQLEIFENIDKKLNEAKSEINDAVLLQILEQGIDTNKKEEFLKAKTEEEKIKILKDYTAAYEKAMETFSKRKASFTQVSKKKIKINNNEIKKDEKPSEQITNSDQKKSEQKESEDKK